MSLSTVDDLFRAFHGTAAVGRAIGRGASTASEMKRRRSIPVQHWPALVDSTRGREIGLTADVLLAMHTVTQASAA